jgi:CarD family transcriptional regulator
MNPFEIGDKVVYPNHGVGIIEKISNRLVAGQKFERFYLLRICSNDILVMVPTANAGDVGLRKIIERKGTKVAAYRGDAVIQMDVEACVVGDFH